MAYSAHRPEGFRKQGDSHLPQLVRRVRRMLSDTQSRFVWDSLRLDYAALDELAGILVDFAEDIHNHTGLWEAYERHNIEFFGKPLPLTPSECSDLPVGLHPDRFRHFLWVLYAAIIDGLTFSPAHEDLLRLADASSAFLSDAFSAIPTGSGVKAFLQTPNVYGWDVKRKLVWLGTHSFMFRTMFARYMDERAHGRADIAHTDDFICQQCTQWSGLGAIDILAGALDVSEGDRQNLRSWYERHAAFYKILSAGQATLKALNLINDQPYRIRINMKRHPFKAGKVVFGSLVPWLGEWYWSGEQNFWPDGSGMDADELKRTMKRSSSKVVCRYSNEYEAQVRERAAKTYESMLKYSGKDLVVYPDGLSMAADWENELRSQWESRPEEEVKEVIERHGLEKGRPNINIPKDLLEQEGGLGVFINPEEGKEIMTHFTALIEGLRQNGGRMSEDQECAIRGFVTSPAISPTFVRRVLGEHGDESVKRAFRLRGEIPAYWLDYFFRRHKGAHYRKRYPSVSVI